MPQGALDMVTAREGEEIVCPKGTLCGRMTRDAHDGISDGDFTPLENASSPAPPSAAQQQHICVCCGRPVAVRENVRWRLHLRRGWVQ